MHLECASNVQIKVLLIVKYKQNFKCNIKIIKFKINEINADEVK